MERKARASDRDACPYGFEFAGAAAGELIAAMAKKIAIAKLKRRGMDVARTGPEEALRKVKSRSLIVKFAAQCFTARMNIYGARARVARNSRTDLANLSVKARREA
jgi:hypothetical protein